MRYRNETLLSTYGKRISDIGTCLTSFQINDEDILCFVKKNFNSVTMENEMKPDFILGKMPELISTGDAEKQGYVMPPEYKEKIVPVLHLSVADNVMDICRKNGFNLRIHTLIWHEQTPRWFFKENFSVDEQAPYVSAEIMDKRIELYIRNFMKYVYENSDSEVVSAWDVINEYNHAKNSDWEKVYGNQGLQPHFVKLGYKIADEMLKKYGVREKTTLVFNDYNTYEVSEEILSVLSYVNSEEKLCDTIGMQAHLDTEYPSDKLFSDTLRKFSNAGYKVQITELDATCKDKNEERQGDYYYRLFASIINAMKNGVEISSLTFWGPSDKSSWRKEDIPLLFSAPDKPKQAFYKVIDAFYDN